MFHPSLTTPSSTTMRQVPYKQTGMLGYIKQKFKMGQKEDELWCWPNILESEYQEVSR
jgi:hypothetical protein